MSGATLSIGGTFTLASTGASELRMGTNSNGTINCSNYTQTGGTLNMSQGSGLGTINVSGSFSASSGNITEGGSNAGIIVFNGSTLQSVSVANTVNGIINFRINNSAGISITGSLPISNGRTFYRTQGTITGTVAYSGTSTLAYDGVANITTTSGEWPTTNAPANVTINNTAGVVLHAPRSISGVLTLTNGTLTTTATNLVTLTSTASGAVSGGGSSSFINGPLDRAIVSGTTYTYPIGAGGNYYPATLSSVVGTSPIVRMQAFAGSSGGSADGTTITTISTTEYWQASLTSGSLTTATLGFSRPTAVGTFNGMGRSTSANGIYGNIGGTASGTQVSGVATGNTLGFYVMGTTVPLYYWSNAASMNWSSAASWQTTTTATYSSPVTATIAPNASNSLGITIRNGHTVSTTGTSINTLIS
jgi:hypothetical protein